MIERNEGRKAASEGAAIIGGGVVITGDVTCEGELQIGGQVIGDVRCGTLFIDEGGEIKGDVQSERLRISGTIDGNVDARDLAIESTGRAIGTLSYERLKINAGGVIDGTLRQRKADQLKPMRGATHSAQVEQKIVDLDAAKPRRVYVD